MKKNQYILILQDIRSAQNVGAIFRTADALGISKIYLGGYTPAPVDRFGRERSDIAKAALGAEKTIEWESVPDILTMIENLKKENFEIIAIEQDEKRGVDYKKVPTPQKATFIMGNEVSGLPEEVLKLCDTIAEIPMNGQKESLNVAVAFGVALFRILEI